MVRYVGHCSNVARGRRLKSRDANLDTTPARDGANTPSW
jgi:hypothetical protein